MAKPEAEKEHTGSYKKMRRQFFDKELVELIYARTPEIVGETSDEAVDQLTLMHVDQRHVAHIARRMLETLSDEEPSNAEMTYIISMFLEMLQTSAAHYIGVQAVEAAAESRSKINPTLILLHIAKGTFT